MGMLDRAGFLAEVDELTAVYGAAMLPPREHLAGRRSMMERHTYHPRFRAVLVRPVGVDTGQGSAPGGTGATVARTSADPAGSSPARTALSGSPPSRTASSARPASGGMRSSASG